MHGGTFLAHGGCARSTSDSHNQAVQPKRHDNSLFFAANKKNEDNTKVALASSNAHEEQHILS